MAAEATTSNDEISSDQDAADVGMAKANPSRPTAVVTGASTGVGKDVAINLIKHGWNVCILARSLDKLQEIVKQYAKEKEGSVKALQCNVGDASQVLSSCEAIEKWCSGKLNLLMNNAGAVINPCGLHKLSVADWDDNINVNLRSTFLFTKYLTSCLKAASVSSACIKYDGNVYDGNVINVSSSLSFDASGYSHGMAYSVAKAGVDQLTRLNAMELSLDKVRVNALSLGVIRTDLWRKIGLDEQQTDGVMQFMTTIHPIGRIGTTDDVVETVHFLASQNRAGWITGTILDLNGGARLNGMYLGNGPRGSKANEEQTGK